MAAENYPPSAEAINISVACDNCKRYKDEKEMIYDSPNDKYFCNQECADKYNGVRR